MVNSGVGMVNAPPLPYFVSAMGKPSVTGLIPGTLSPAHDQVIIRRVDRKLKALFTLPRPQHPPPPAPPHPGHMRLEETATIPSTLADRGNLHLLEPLSEVPQRQGERLLYCFTADAHLPLFSRHFWNSRQMVVAHEEGIVGCKGLVQDLHECFVIGWPERAFNQWPLARQGMQDSRFHRPCWESLSTRSPGLGLL